MAASNTTPDGTTVGQRPSPTPTTTFGDTSDDACRINRSA